MSGEARRPVEVIENGCLCGDESAKHGGERGNQQVDTKEKLPRGKSAESLVKRPLLPLLLKVAGTHLNLTGCLRGLYVA